MSTATLWDKSNLYVRGVSADAALEKIKGYSAEDLATVIVNERLNNFIAERSKSTFEDDHEDTPIPFQGWFWRNVDFFTPGGITIADGDGGVGICQNNKWDYPSRDLTNKEQKTFRDLVWEAYIGRQKGGNLSEIEADAMNSLRKAGAFISALGVSS